MYARSQVEKNIRSARDLYSKFRSRDIQGGCLPISILALGGRLTFPKILELGERANHISTLQNSGLDLGGFIQIEEEVSEEYIEEILEVLTTVQNEELPENALTGFLVLSYFLDERSSANHFFVILTRQSMKPRVRKHLEMKREYKVVDSVGGTLTGRMRISDFVKYLNEMVRIGGKCTIYQVFKV